MYLGRSHIFRFQRRDRGRIGYGYPNDHQFRIEKVNGETIALRVSDEGIIIDIEDETGEVIRSAYQFWCDLDELTWRDK